MALMTVCGYHVYKDISELPCSPEQIFVEIVMPCDQKIAKGTAQGTAGFGRLQGCFCCSKAVSGQHAELY